MPPTPSRAIIVPVSFHSPSSSPLSSLSSSTPSSPSAIKLRRYWNVSSPTLKEVEHAPSKHFPPYEPTTFTVDTASELRTLSLASIWFGRVWSPNDETFNPDSAVYRKPNRNPAVKGARRASRRTSNGSGDNTDVPTSATLPAFRTQYPDASNKKRKRAATESQAAESHVATGDMSTDLPASPDLSTGLSPSSAPALAKTITTTTTTYAVKRPRLSKQLRGVGLEDETLICEINLKALEGDRKEKVEIKDYRFLASYSRTGETDATILVPGAPPKWLAPTVPMQLESTTTTPPTPVDGKVAPSNISPLLPLFGALGVMQPSPSLSKTALVTNRDNLFKLLAFTSGEHKGDTWRMDAEVIDETLFLTLQSKSERSAEDERIKLGLEGNFMEKCVDFEETVGESTKHCRVVEYVLGGVKCVVEFEVDGYVDDSMEEEVEDMEEESETESVDSDDDKEDEDEDDSEDEAVAEDEDMDDAPDPKQAEGFITPSSLLDLTISMTDFSIKDSTKTIATDTLTIIQKGHQVPMASIFALKYVKHQARPSFLKKEDILKCYLSQTKLVHKGTHTDGVVKKIDCKDIGPRIQVVENEYRDKLGRMLGLIEEIRRVVGMYEGQKCVLALERRENVPVLKLYESGERGMGMSSQLKSRFWSGATVEMSEG